jgi:hypothetical protein
MLIKASSVLSFGDTDHPEDPKNPPNPLKELRIETRDNTKQKKTKCF